MQDNARARFSKASSHHSYIIVTNNKKLCYCRQTVWRAMWVKFLSTVKTSCLWQIHNKSHGVTVDRIVVTAKTRRLSYRCHQQTRPSTTTTSSADNASDLLRQNFFPKSGVWDKVPEESTLIFGDTDISLKTHCRTGGRKPPCQKPARFIQSFWYNTGLWWTDRQTRGHTMTANAVPALRHTVKLANETNTKCSKVIREMAKTW